MRQSWPLNPSSSWYLQADLHSLKWKCYYTIEYGTSSLMRPNSRSSTNTRRRSKITIPLRSDGVDMMGFHQTEKGWRIFKKFPILNWVSENYLFVHWDGTQNYTQLNELEKYEKANHFRKKTQILFIKKFCLRIHHICWTHLKRLKKPS